MSVSGSLCRNGAASEGEGRGRSRLLAGSHAPTRGRHQRVSQSETPAVCPSSVGRALPNKPWPLMDGAAGSCRVGSTEGQDCSPCLQSLHMRAGALSLWQKLSEGDCLTTRRGRNPLICSCLLFCHFLFFFLHFPLFFLLSSSKGNVAFLLRYYYCVYSPPQKSQELVP